MNKYQLEKEQKELEAQKRKQIEQMLVDSSRVFSTEEMSLVSNTFFGNDLLLVLRKFLLQGDLTQEETNRLKAVSDNEQIISIIRRSTIPVIDAGSPYSSDTWLDIKTEEKGAGETYNDILSKLVLIHYIEQQLDRLQGKKVVYSYHIKGSCNQWENGDIRFTGLIPTGNEGFDGSFVNLQARNNLINKVNGTLNQLNMFAIQHQKPEEEEKKRIMDSNK